MVLPDFNLTFVTKLELEYMEVETFDDRYVKLQLEGRGGFAEVWKVYDMLTSTIQALKIFGPSSGTGVDGIKMLAREYAIMNLVHHENLLTPDNFAIYDNKVPYLVLRYCHRGNLQKMVGQIAENEAWQILLDMARALECLHKRRRPIIHQDIKPANILLDDAGYYVLTDFGVSTKFKQVISTLTDGESTFKLAGSQAYMAPERFTRNNRPIFANDTYSLGVTMFELLSEYLPFGEKGGQLQAQGLEIPELPGDFSPLLKSTIESCLEPDPAKRPLVSKLIEVSSGVLAKHPKGRVLYDGRDDSVDYATLHAMSVEYFAKKESVNTGNIGETHIINDRPTIPFSQDATADGVPFQRKSDNAEWLYQELGEKQPQRSQASVNADWLHIKPVSQRQQKRDKSGKGLLGCVIFFIISFIAIIIFAILK